MSEMPTTRGSMVMVDGKLYPREEVREVTTYLHSTKEQMHDLYRGAFHHEPTTKFLYALYEIEVTMWIAEDGRYEIKEFTEVG